MRFRAGSFTRGISIKINQSRYFDKNVSTQIFRRTVPETSQKIRRSRYCGQDISAKIFRTRDVERGGLRICAEVGMAVCPIRHIDPLVLHPRAIECVSQPLHHVNGHPSMHLPYEDSLKFDGIGTDLCKRKNERFLTFFCSYSDLCKQMRTLVHFLADSFS